MSGPVLLMLVISGAVLADAKMTVYEKLREDADLSQFLALLERNMIANSTIQYRQMTLFAPTNAAFQKYTGDMDDSLVLYHIIRGHSKKLVNVPEDSRVLGRIWACHKIHTYYHRRKKSYYRHSMIGE
ncbi:fasciclin domain-containing protein [Phthorimaea operculella]|nr:fasciclin domain-containing protein [Phthorimaea operculella]